MNYEHIFDKLEISPEPFAVCELKGACNLDLGRDATATLHYILTGHGRLQIRDRPEIPIQPGTLILVPALQRHSLHSAACNHKPVPECKPAELELRHLLKTSDIGSSSSELIALCAHVRVGLRDAEDVIDLIRNPLVETIEDKSPVRPAIELLLQELSAPTYGSRAMIKSILNLCVIEMFRRKLHQDDSALRWMAALRDPQVWEALRVMIDAPGEAHTVDNLAERVGMSRSTFANRFSAVYGSGPIVLLRDLRLRKAAALLRDTAIPVKSIASMVGFTSRTSFSRLFEQRIGQSPLQFRKSQQEAL